MRVRTGLTPDAWRDEGPQQGRMIPMAYSSVHASNVGQMAPVVSGKMLMTVNEAARNRRRSAVAKAARAAS